METSANEPLHAPRPRRSAWRRAGELALFLAAAVVVYAPALRGTRVWDDNFLVGENPFFRSPVFLLEVFRHYLFLDRIAPYFRPIQNWSYLADYLVAGGSMFGFHLSSALWHGLGGFLLYRVLRGLPAWNAALADRQPDRWALLVALVWTVHPAHNAAVAYVSGRADSLALVFGLGGWLCFRRSRDAGGTAGWYAFALGLWLLAFCSRESALVLGAIFVVVELVWGGGFATRFRLFRLGGMLLPLGIYAWLRSLPGANVQGAGADEAGGLVASLGLTAAALGDYAAVLVAPIRLTMDRGGVGEAGIRILLPALLLVGGLIGGCLWRAPGVALRRLGAMWFVVAFLPISPIFAKNAVVAEHWMYLPSIGFLAFVAGVAAGAPRTMAGAAAVAMSLWGVLLAGRTLVRSDDWTSQDRFIERTLAAGGKSERISCQLAGAALKRGEPAEAEKILREVLRDDPGAELARAYLGVCLIAMGREADGMAQFSTDPKELERLSRRHPFHARGVILQARQLAASGATEEAVEWLGFAESLWNGNWPLVREQVRVLENAGKPRDALARLRDYVEGNWWNLEATMDLARRSEPVEAGRLLERATRLDVRSPTAWEALANLREMSGDTRGAVRALEQAAKRAPEDTEIRSRLEQLRAAPQGRS